MRFQVEFDLQPACAQLEAARLCGSGAGGAQANLLSMHWASQARTRVEVTS